MAPYSSAHRRAREETAPGFQREHGRLLAEGDRISEEIPDGRRAHDLSGISSTPCASSRAFFGVAPDEFTLTNGTDEAIQVLINTFVDDGDDVLLLKPSYAMYRFYAEVAGATVREIDYARTTSRFRSTNSSTAIRPETRAILIANPNNPTGTAIGLDDIQRFSKPRPMRPS